MPPPLCLSVLLLLSALTLSRPSFQSGPNRIWYSCEYRNPKIIVR